MKRKKICDGLEVQHGEDGHWLLFKSDGKSAMINVENTTFGIVRDAVLAWIDEQLKEVGK